ncbi:hypothetical protein TRFO_03866 [Tritrichomonas foetus]|uniref:Uncharacterized protein n=1 Tax=Tritrichomonas foetus TaxID=1144522 RepID=A0A1J4KK25_9EUKA|nr:hypothetical protein TRFO_03866 [Tritrichomonas foetus]|eukprot:OHT11657.1 hypothetical protein TRFO_03866 [Tritrichomonas foetus]
MADQACCSGCPCKKVLTDASALEEKLKPYEEYVDQVQAMLYFRNPIAMAAVLVLVNLLFFVIGKLHLSFLPTLFLLLTLKVFVKLVVKVAGPIIAAFLFQPIENKEEGTYPIYPLQTVCETIVLFTSRIFGLCDHAKPKGPLTIANAVVPLGALAALFFLFLITGTFWLNFILVNLVLILPAVLLHPAVKKQIEPFVEKLEKVKVE